MEQTDLSKENETKNEVNNNMKETRGKTDKIQPNTKVEFTGLKNKANLPIKTDVDSENATINSMTKQALENTNENNATDEEDNQQIGSNSSDDEEERYLRLSSDTSNLTKTKNKIFLRRLTNEFLRYKLYEKQEKVSDNTEHETCCMSHNWRMKSLHFQSKDMSVPLQKTVGTMRKVSMEMERQNPVFFTTICNRLRLQDDIDKLEDSFRSVTEEVLNEDFLNWGRVVSLFTFGGKVAQWCWETKQEEKIEEVEDWLADSLSEKNADDWIEANGGWEKFNEQFESPPQGKFGWFGSPPQGKFAWLTSGLLVCAGISLAAVITMKSVE